MEQLPWDIEPHFLPCHVCTTIKVVLRTVVYQPGHHLCSTMIHGQQVHTNCVFQRGSPCHTVLQGHLACQMSMVDTHDTGHEDFSETRTRDDRAVPGCMTHVQGLEQHPQGSKQAERM